MTSTSRPHAPTGTEDQRLRQSLREALARTPGDDLQALESRALTQWRLHTTAGVRPAGPLAVWRTSWHRHSLAWKGALLALGVAGLLLAQPWAPSDGGMDDALLQPDVLSLVTLGAL